MVKVQIGEVKRFMTDCLRAAGARVQPAREQAELLTYADAVGLRGYGIKKLFRYVEDIKKGVCKPNNEPIILKEKMSTASVDAKDVMAATAGSFAMDLAIKKANETGIGWINVKGSHQNAEPYSYWTQKAADNDLIGMVFSNTSTIQEPPAKKKEEGKRIQVPLRKKIVIKKISTARNRASSSGKRDIELDFKSIKQVTGTAVPELAAMVDLSGTKNNAVKRSWSDEPLAQNLGQCFVAVNPACFALGFDGKLVETLPYWKQIDPFNPKLLELPLDDLKRKLNTGFRESDMIRYELQLINAIIDLAVTLNVKPLRLHESEEKVQ